MANQIEPPSAPAPTPRSVLHPLVLVLIHFGYLVAAVLIVTSIDPFIIFSHTYAVFTVHIPSLLVPGLMIFWQIKYKRWHWGIVIVGCLLSFGVSFLHLLLLAAASATV